MFWGSNDMNTELKFCIFLTFLYQITNVQTKEIKSVFNKLE